MNSFSRVASRLLGPGVFRIYLAAMVVLAHVSSIMLGGWAVFLFFLLSGFWVSLMWREKYSGFAQPYWVFILSRYWRLAPVYFLSLALAAVLFTWAGFTAADQFNWKWWLAISPIAFSWNFHPPLQPLWSLDVEFQFYVLFPALFAIAALFGPRGRSIGLGVLVITTLGFLGTGVAYMHSPYVQLCLYYLGFFVAGMWIESRNKQTSGKLALASLIVTGLLFGAILILPETRALLIYNASVSVSPAGNPFVSGVLTFSLIPFVAWLLARPSDSTDRHLGNLAYPLYAFHMIPITFYNHYFREAAFATKLTGVLLALLASFALTAFFYWLVDQPFDALRRRWLKGRKKRAISPSSS